MASATPQIPPLPQGLPKTQADWTAVANAWQAMQAMLQGPRWTAPTLLNSWVYYGAPYNPPGYMLDGTGRVWLRGLLKGGNLVSIAFTMPWKPQYTQLLSGSYMTSGGTVAVSGRVDVDAAGNVTLGTNDTAGAVSWFCLDGLSFDLRV